MSGHPLAAAAAMLLLGALCGCLPPHGAAGDRERTHMARAALFAAVTPWASGVVSHYGEVVRIETLWSLDIDTPDVRAAAVPGQDARIDIGHHRIDVMLESGELRSFARSHLGDLRVGDQVRLFGNTPLRT